MNLSASTLRYRLIEGPMQLEPLRILASRHADWGDRRITFCVLGASHAVRLEHHDGTLTELLACAALECESDVRMDLAGSEPQKACRIVADLLCRVELIPFALSAGESLHGAFAASDTLEVAYPAPSHAPTPYTRIGWRLSADALHVETVHTYPEENLGIRSFSHFRCEENLR